MELLYLRQAINILELVWSDKDESLHYKCTGDEQYLCGKTEVMVLLDLEISE